MTAIQRSESMPVALTGLDGRQSLAWVMTWLEGRHPEPEEMGPTHMREWGRVSARLGQALRGFVHPAASYPIAWDIRRLPQLRPWLTAGCVSSSISAARPTLRAR